MMSTFESDLASIYLSRQPSSSSSSDTECIQTSCQYRQVLGDHSSALQPVWYAVELLYLRAHSSTGQVNPLTWTEFCLALSSQLYRKFFFPQRSTNPIRQVLSGHWDTLGIDAPPGDLRSPLHYHTQWNRWRQESATQASDPDLRRVFGGIDYDLVVIRNGLDWLEQTILALGYYEERLPANQWETLFAFVAELEAPSGNDDPVSLLTKLILSGQLIAAVAAMADWFPADQLWFACHLFDLVKQDELTDHHHSHHQSTKSTEAGQSRTEDLGKHFAVLYGQALVNAASTDDDSLFSVFFLGLEYLVRVSEDVGEYLLSVQVDDNYFHKALDMAKTCRLPCTRIMFERLVNVNLGVSLQRALLFALESGHPDLVDAVCQRIWEQHISGTGMVNVGVEPELLDSSPYPLLQLALDYNEWNKLRASGDLSSSASLLSNILIHRRLPGVFLEHLMSRDLEAVSQVGLPAMVRLLGELDRAESVSDKIGKRMALLYSISCLLN